MRGFIAVFSMLIQLLCAVAAIEAGGKTLLYTFCHNDVGTVANYIILNGGERGIKFHESSDMKALKAFKCLNPSIFLPNSSRENQNIILEGELHTEVFKTSETYNMLQAEEYQYFTLNKWYILTPFIENKAFSEDYLSGEQPAFLDRTSLEKSDFECEIEIDPEGVLMSRKELTRRIDQ